MGQPTPIVVPEAPGPGDQWGQDHVIVSRVHVTVGERVADGQPLADVETDKISLELGSPVPGVVSDLRVRPDDTVPLGAVLMVIDADE
ncbi:biotin/lipoyl-containing protein [Streptomyces sp. 8N616]|uniref:biotin/lipoyl-containing protein n=1 Tax=Streptomyces sp. 8N616 TaxID=3457414 RepID=UPI003FD55264